MGTRLQSAMAALITLIPLAVVGCGTSEPRQVAVALTSAVVEAPTLEITPAAGAAGLPASTEIGTTVGDGSIAEVLLVDAAGTRIGGGLREDGTSWVPERALDYDRSYTATVTASGAGGTTTQTTTFTTMAKPTGSRIGTSLYLTTGRTYGVAMPVVVTFKADIPAEARAQVQRRLFVHSEPAQSGAWRWFGARSVLYRPESYWKPGTTITVRAALSGLPIGKRFGDTDRAATVSIGRDLHIDVNNATKRMSVIQDGQVIKTIPVSLGKASTPSSSGTTVIISKFKSTIFDTTQTDGPDGYRIQVSNAQRLTWGGEFIHSAPWSVGDQGRRNVSHGCINVSPSNASWLFGKTLIGDPVTTRGTRRKLAAGNGWTVWNMSWPEYIS